MITVVAILFFPFVLAMSAFRLYQLPRDIVARRKWFNRSHLVVAVQGAAGVTLARRRNRQPPQPPAPARNTSPYEPSVWEDHPAKRGLQLG